MLGQIKQFFSGRLDPNQAPAESREPCMRLATAALLIEVMRADFSVGEMERATLIELLERQFELTGDDLQQLIRLAEDELNESVSLYQFTRLINDHYSAAQKIQLMECLWQVAFADGHLDKYEDHLIRTLADLLHVPHSDFIRTKLRVQDAL